MLPSIALSLSVFSTLVAALPSAEPDNALHVPLQRRSSLRPRSGYIDISRYEAARDALRVKYGYSPPATRKRASQSDNAITNQGGDTSYFANVNIGTPAQTFGLVLDTGSSDLWFASSSCTNCPQGTPEFNGASSSSLQTSSNSVQLSYGSGQASGTIAQDTVSFGGFTVNNQVFVAVDTLSTGLIDGSLAGIMGLGFDTIAATKSTPFWQSLLNSNQLSNPEMSFFITRFLATATSQTETDPGGTFTLGGTNSTLFQGDIDFQDFPSNQVQSFWLQTVSSLTLNGASVDVGSASSNLAAIDTGTTLLGGPTQAVTNFWNQVPNSQALSGSSAGFWGFPCSTNLSVSLAFGGKSWPINPLDMNLGQISRTLCMGGLFDVTQGASVGPNTPSWIVGDTFLKNVYTVFRASPLSVGFAELSDAAGGSSEPSPSALPSVTSVPIVPTPSVASRTASQTRTSSALSFASGSVTNSLASTGTPTSSGSSSPRVSNNPGLPTTAPTGNGAAPGIAPSTPLVVALSLALLTTVLAMLR